MTHQVCMEFSVYATFSLSLILVQRNAIIQFIRTSESCAFRYRITRHNWTF